jgi:hypothetical protein
MAGSSASTVFSANLQRVDDVLSFHAKSINPEKGSPPGPDRSLVLGAVALVYASWEAYIEQVAVEAVDHLSRELRPDQVPDSVQQKLAGIGSPWALAGDGWRAEWRALIRSEALGEGTSAFGLNTASADKVRKLFRSVGVKPFEGVSWQNANTTTVKKRLGKLVSARGQIVHTATAPNGVGLNSAREHRDFADRLVGAVDKRLSAQIRDLGAPKPW